MNLAVRCSRFLLNATTEKCVLRCSSVPFSCNSRIFSSSTSAHTSGTSAPVKALTGVVHKIKAVPSTSGSASDAAAEEFRVAYAALDKSQKSEALVAMANQFHIDPGNLAVRCQEYLKSLEEDPKPTTGKLKNLEHALRPLYKKVFVSVGLLHGGVKFLVDFRADLHDEISRNVKAGNASIVHDLREMDNVLYDLMTVWFGRGFLSLQRVTWDSPCSFLEKIAGGEAVHPMRHWLDLKRRLGAYRRCFGFTHESMPGEPLIVVHVALMPSITSSIHDITRAYKEDALVEQTEDPKKIDCAIFYSISAMQRGLRGVELGGHLIKKVVERIRWEYPHLQKFSTLSPIPGFRPWLLVRLQEAARGSERGLLTEDETEAWKGVLGKGDLWQAAVDVFQKNSWVKSKDMVAVFEPAITRLCARYLFVEKHRGFALDPVANFHLRNGAVLWRINYMGDMSPRGLERSCGMMVNYRYYLETVEENSHRYSREKIVAVEDSIAAMVTSKSKNT